MKNWILITLFFSLINCKKASEKEINYFRIVSNTKNQINYKFRNDISKSMIEMIEEDLSKNYKFYSVKENNSTSFYGYEKRLLKAKSHKLEPIINSLLIRTSKLTCDKKITFEHNELNFTFCLKDVLAYYDRQIAIGNSDIYHEKFKHDKKIIRELVFGKKSKITNEKLVYELIENLPVNVFDRVQKNNMDFIILNKCLTGWSCVNEYYFLINNKDTIANYRYQIWVK